MSEKTTTVLVVLADGAHALSRLLALCHRRGWTPVSLRSVSHVAFAAARRKAPWAALAA
jgi:hypothetical protein